MCDRATRSAQARSIPRPRWSVLYGLVAPAAVALLAVEVTLPPGPARTALDLGVVWGAFAVIAVWLRGQRATGDLQAWCGCASAHTTVRVIEFRSQEVARDREGDRADSPARRARSRRGGPRPVGRKAG